MNYYFSATTNMFYPDLLLNEYKATNSLPDDVKKVSTDDFELYAGTPPAGKMRVPGEGGLPEWGDIPPPTQDELIALATNEKQQRVDAANGFMNSKQWPGKAALGRLKDEDLTQYGEWLDYLDLLDAVDVSLAPQVQWPVPPVAQVM
ncbi:tail fiber assembly protein [Kosakonia sacchari]|uniref:tail fiber assembly protein n=1 Tax=Kosakonia sacchari TaxID=1158459 RepID=UPI001585510A|nr:tail fiber assembly protein [Kosakonia sacchari]NUL36314.1 tail fiber assembly protein [Kosakonia sacchari]